MAVISSAKLLEYLIQLPIKLDQNYCLEFGDPDHRQMSGVQVSYITTAGGPQYRVCRVNAFGQQYASTYTPSYEAAFDLALDYKDAYTRPDPRLQELRAKTDSAASMLESTSKLGWFEATLQDTSQFPAALHAHQYLWQPR
jgi:hypothetical protein